MSDVLGKLQKFVSVDFLTKEMLPVAGGFVGAKFAGKFIKDLVGPTVSGFIGSSKEATAFVNMGSQALGASLLSYAVGRFIDRSMGEKVFIGAVVSIGHELLKLIVPALLGDKVAADLGLSGFGDISDSMRDAVSRRVEAQLSGMGEFMNVTALRPQLNGLGMGEYVNTTALRPQGAFAPALRDSGMGDGDSIL